MCYYPDNAFADDVLKYGGFEKLVKNIKNHLIVYKDQYTWHRVPSLRITNEQIQDR